MEDFEEWKKELGPRSRPIAVLFMDIDKFKSLNERYHHTKVDRTILPQSQQLTADLAMSRGAEYRYAGDEYALILPNHDITDAMQFGEKVRKTFEQYDFRVKMLRNH